MTRFARILPALLPRTDVVLELRDARLPLTSVNRIFEGKRWRHTRRASLPSHRYDANDNGASDPERFARVVRFLHNTRKSNPEMTKMAHVHYGKTDGACSMMNMWPLFLFDQKRPYYSLLGDSIA